MSTPPPLPLGLAARRAFRILLVEDDRVDEMSFRRAVAKEGLAWEVTSAASVTQAGACMAAQDFDVIITDYLLGDGTAFDVASKGGRTPWIIVTGAGDEAVAVAALRAGAHDYIVKSGDGAHLKILPFAIEGAIKLTRARTVARMLSHAMTSVRDAVYITDLGGNFLFANAAFERLYGYDPAALGGATTELLNGEGAVAPGAAQVAAGWVGEVVQKRQDGALRPVWLSISPVADEGGEVTALVHVGRDLTERRRLEDTLTRANQELERANAELERSRAALEELAIRDELTGLYNRRELNRMMEDELARSARSRQPLSLILIDVDHFKKVNDVYGHLAGDAVLRGLGQVLVRALRRVDRAARFGGEELALLLPDTPEHEAIKVAERIRQLIAITPFAAAGDDGTQNQIFVTASLGLAAFGANLHTAEGLFRRADQALYRAKGEGRNRVVSLDVPASPGGPSRPHPLRMF